MNDSNYSPSLVSALKIARGMSVSDIEEEMREIYEIELSTSAISIITNKVKNPEQTFSILEQILKLHPDADIRSQYQQEKLTEEFFAQIFADFQPEETYNESPTNVRS